MKWLSIASFERPWEEEVLCPFCAGRDTAWVEVLQDRLCTSCEALVGFGWEELEPIEEPARPFRLSA